MIIGIGWGGMWQVDGRAKRIWHTTNWLGPIRKKKDIIKKVLRKNDVQFIFETKTRQFYAPLYGWRKWEHDCGNILLKGEKQYLIHSTSFFERKDKSLFLKQKDKCREALPHPSQRPGPRNLRRGGPTRAKEEERERWWKVTTDRNISSRSSLEKQQGTLLSSLFHSFLHFARFIVVGHRREA